MTLKDLIVPLNYSRSDYRKPDQFVKIYIGSDGRNSRGTVISTDPILKFYEDREVKEIWLTHNYEIDEPILNIEVV